MLGGLLGGSGSSLIDAHGFTCLGWSVAVGVLLTVSSVPCDSVEVGSGGVWLDVCQLPWAALWVGSEFSRASNTLLPEPR